MRTLISTLAALSVVLSITLSASAHADEGDDEAEPPVVATAVFRAALERVEAKVLTKLEEKIESKQEASMDRFSSILSAFSCLGVLLLGAPLVLRRRYPGKSGTLFKYGALAAGTFFVAVNLFAVVLMLLRSVQGELGKATNPQIALVTASISTLHDNAEEIAAFGPSVLEPTIADLEGGDGDEPMPVVLVENIAKSVAGLSTISETFLSVAKFLKSVNWIFGYLPMILTLMAVLLFLKGMQPMLREIVVLPARAASGERGAARRVLKSVFGRIWRELLATL
jgi:hypothetical protein